MRRICLVGAEGIARIHAGVPGRIPAVSVVAEADPARFHESIFATGP